jgi:hypothetical protein
LILLSEIEFFPLPIAPASCSASQPLFFHPGFANQTEKIRPADFFIGNRNIFLGNKSLLMLLISRAKARKISFQQSD